MKKFLPITALILTLGFLLIPSLILAQNPQPTPPQPGGPRFSNIQDIQGLKRVLESVANALLVIFVAIAVFFFLMAAFKYLTSGGDTEKTGEAMKAVIYGLIAVAIAVLAKALPLIISNLVLQTS